MLKRIIAVFLVLVLMISLSGCSKDKKNETGGNDRKISNQTDDTKDIADIKMGRYMEQEVKLPEFKGKEGVTKVLQNAEKQLELYTVDSANGTYNRYLLKEDGSWQQSTPSWLNSDEIKKQQAQLMDLCLGEDGNYYACFQSYTNGVKSIIAKASPDGQEAQIMDMPFLNKVEKTVNGTDYCPMVDKIAALKSGNIVICDAWSQDKLLVLSPAGEKIDSVDSCISDSTGSQDFLIYDNNIITTDKDGKVITYDTEAKNTVQSLEYEGNNSGKAYARKDDGTLIVGDAAGIHRVAQKGTLWETTVDGALNSMSMPSLTILGLFVTEGKEQEEYYAAYVGDQEYQLKHYVYNNDVPSVPEKEITVYSLKENSTIRQAISLFQAKDADVKINYVVAMGTADGKVTDYIRALNTELLSGKGADVLLLDELPVDSYIEKGVLADLSEIIDKRKASGDLLTNIADCYYKEGETYRMPVRFGVPIILGSKEAVNASDSLEQLVAYINSSGKTYTAQTTYKQLLQDYLALYISDISNKDELDQAKLKEFLSEVKVIADNCKADANADQSNFAYGDGNRVWDINHDLFNNNILTIGKIEAGTIQINNVSDIMIPNQLIKDKKLIFNTIGQHFIPKGLVGLNKASKNIEIAKDFISFLFSSEVQNTNLYDGFPVNAASFEKWFEEDNPDISLAVSDQDGNMISALWPTNEERQPFKDAFNQINKPIEINQILYDMIIESAEPYLSGEADIDQVVSEIMSKANTYLAE